MSDTTQTPTTSPSIPRRGRFAADDLLALNLASGMSGKDAAKASGVSYKTCIRRLTDPGFLAKVESHRATIFRETLGILSANATAAAEALGELLKDQSATVRMSAARLTIENALSLWDRLSLYAEVAQLRVTVTDLASSRLPPSHTAP